MYIPLSGNKMRLNTYLFFSSLLFKIIVVGLLFLWCSYCSLWLSTILIFYIGKYTIHVYIHNIVIVTAII